MSSCPNMFSPHSSAGNVYELVSVFIYICRMKTATNNMGHLAIHSIHSNLYPDGFAVYNLWIGARKTNIQVNNFLLVIIFFGDI